MVFFRPASLSPCDFSNVQSSKDLRRRKPDQNTETDGPNMDAQHTWQAGGGNRATTSEQYFTANEALFCIEDLV